MSGLITNALRRFFALESAGGFVLVIAASFALIMANSPFSHQYENFLKPAHGFINEGLMSIFFFLVGLEIRREFVQGEFQNRKAAALPVIAALGGMVTPALIYLLFNAGRSGANGWAVPMPTDIALALGALALLGSRIDTSLKIFLLTLAIADDLGSIIVLAIFYSDGLSFIKIAATIGAIVLAWIIPTGKTISLDALIQAIHPWATFVVIPLFALANVGLRIDFNSLPDLITSPVTYGIIISRVVGKLVGITLFAWISVRIGIAQLPNSLTFKEISGAAALAGMGLTVSLFIADLAFAGGEVLNGIKLGLIVSAFISALIGLSILRKYSSAQD
ncbi:MAG: Na+/H+ antiporter NhaA [Actinobacteria bacterium]|nr:Na+/H+ antiporter NhaA [Actinomycetota bacterium]